MAMQHARGYARHLAGPKPIIKSWDCDQCGKDDVPFILGFQWRDQTEGSRFANSGRHYVKCLAGKDCKPRFVTDEKKPAELKEYEDVHEECVRKANAESNVLKTQKKAVTAAYEASQLAATSIEGLSEAAIELADSAKRALTLAKTALQAASLVSCKINGTTHVVQRRATRTPRPAAEASSSSPAKRKSEADSSPSERVKRAKVKPEASSSKVKTPKAGPSKVKSELKFETIKGEKVFLIPDSDEEFARDLSPEL